MPRYDYDCASCGRRFEVVHGVHAPGPAHCPNCGGGPLKKAITAAAVHFKGSGWAKRDRRATVASTAKASADAGSTTESGADAGSAADAPKPDKSTATDGGAGERPAPSAKTPGAAATAKAD